MILTFSKEKFKRKILLGKKIHTIREDKTNRWFKGRVAQLWLGNPRNTRAKAKPHFFQEVTIVSVQEVIIKSFERMNDSYVTVDGRRLDLQETRDLAWNDGFENLVEFWLWFNADFTGKIIHWTDKKY